MKSRRAAFTPARLLTAMSLVAATVDGQAAQPSYEISAGAGYSDNIGRTPIDPKSDTVATVGANFGVLERTSRLDLNVAGDLAYYDYLDNTFDSELVGSFLGRARIDLIPERLTWTFQDTFGQATLDPLAAVTPANREDVNYFSTGPDFSVGLGSAMRLVLSGRYSKVSYEDSPLDNDRKSGAVSLVRDLSAATKVSLDVRRESIEFDEGAANPDYDRDEAYVHYETQGGRTRLGMDLGYTRLQGLADSPSGVLARLELSRQVSASSVVTLAGGRQFSDAGSSFRLAQTLDGASLDTISSIQTGSPFRTTYGTATWNFQKNRTGLGVTLGQFDESYETQPNLDRKRLSLDANLTRALTPQLSGQLGASVARENYDSLQGDFRDTGFTVGFNQRLGRRLSIDLLYQRFRRTGDIQLATYSENRAWLTFRFGETFTNPGYQNATLPSDSML